MDGYEEFKFNNSVIGAIYSASPGGPDKNNAKSKQQAEMDLKNEVENDGSFYYHYGEYMRTWLM